MTGPMDNYVWSKRRSEIRRMAKEYAEGAGESAPRSSHYYDAVNHPKHYTTHPSGVECITVTEHMGFCLGNAMKYIWRADEKGSAVEDLEKAKWYIDREIARRTTS